MINHELDRILKEHSITDTANQANMKNSDKPMNAEEEFNELSHAFDENYVLLHRKSESNRNAKEKNTGGRTESEIPVKEEI